MRLQPLFVCFICAIAPLVIAGRIPQRFEAPQYNYAAIVKNPKMEGDNKEIEERRSGRRNPTLNSGLLFGKRFDGTDNFVNDDETREINVEIRARNKLPFHSGLMQGKRNQLEEEGITEKRTRPVFHSGIMMGKRYQSMFDDEDLDEFKRKAGQRLRWSDEMQFGK